MARARTKDEVSYTMTDRIEYISVDAIQPNRFQPRRTFDAKPLEELAESIDKQGLIQPITVREIDDGEEGIEYELIAGERRLRATRDILQKSRIKAIIRDVSDEKLAEDALIENIQRSDLNAIDEAEAILALMNRYDLTQEQMASRLGKTRAYVGNTVRLVKLSDHAKEVIRSGALTKNHALSILTIPTFDEQNQFVDEILKKGWGSEKTRQEANKLIRQAKGKAPTTPKDEKSEFAGWTKYTALVHFDSTGALNEHAAQLEKFGFHVWKGEEAKKMAKKWWFSRKAKTEDEQETSTAQEEGFLTDEVKQQPEVESKSVVRRKASQRKRVSSSLVDELETED